MTSVESKRSPESLSVKLNPGHGSDSDASAEVNSVSADSALDLDHHQISKKDRRRSSEWEIIEGLKDGQRFEKKPEIYNGFLHKKRKWPLKGWHKRYFILDKGILTYGKGPAEINRGKIHGSIDIGLSVISSKSKRRRLDIDTEEFIYHLKAKTDDAFSKWVQQLTIHRLYRQHTLTYGSKSGTNYIQRDEQLSFLEKPLSPEISQRDASLPRGLKSMNNSGLGRFGSVLLESGSKLEQVQRDATLIQQNLVQLANLLKRIDSQTNSFFISGEPDAVSEGFSPNVKKDRKKFGLKKKKSSKGSSADLTANINRAISINAENASPLSNNSFIGFSTTSLAQGNCVTDTTSLISASDLTLRPYSLPPDYFSSNGDQFSFGITDNNLRDDFVSLAKEVLRNLNSAISIVCTERNRLKSALESDVSAYNNHTAHSNTAVELRANLSQALQQNNDLRKRLSQIHDTSDLAELSFFEPNTETNRNATHSYSSSCVSASEFLDAEEFPRDEIPIQLEDLEAEVQTRGSDSSSEAGSLSSEEGSISSESEPDDVYNPAANLIEIEGKASQGLTGRRTTLPAIRTDTEGLSLWNLLCKNIGKDLSQISMPVALNEPLNMLQRLCEELEYSELLDKAAELDDPYERIVQVAAFAMSGYASSFSRAGNKPFNPLLGETYECVREDRGFRFLAEQVSHHPPISACHAESRNFIFWQEARIKTKFWGKSMEFLPLGKVQVLLPRTGDLYTWNKVTTCVHNLFSGQRWVDQYGELHLTNGRISCKLTFSKASYWSAKRYEVVGAVFNEDGKAVRQLFGKWSEALYCGVAPAARCVWRAGTLPPNHEQYYGFTRFAIELNELGPDSSLLPPTDTRLRPDQRALEEGDVILAEQRKLQLEGNQRERRKRKEELSIPHQPRWFTHRSSANDDIWEYSGKYWECRKNPGFGKMSFDPLW